MANGSVPGIGNEALLAGKVAIVTGGASGIGAACARLLVEHGARTAVLDVDVEAAAAVAAGLGEHGMAHVMDVSSEAAWQDAALAVEARWGGVDILVNNAGLAHRGLPAETSAADFLRVVEVNQLGTFLGMRTVEPFMRRRGGGSIVNVSSTAAQTGNRWLIAYAGSKAAILAMSRTAAVAYGPAGIRVNSVLPGGVRTPMTQEHVRWASDRVPTFATGDGSPLRRPLGRWATPDEVARTIVFLASPLSSFTTGAEVAVDGGALTHPASIDHLDAAEEQRR